MTSTLSAWCDEMDAMTAEYGTDIGVMLSGASVPMLVAVIRAAERRRQARADRSANHMKAGWGARAAVYYNAEDAEDAALANLTAHLREGSVADGE